MKQVLRAYVDAGMDAQVAYGFHTLRNEKPYLAQGPISNKVQIVPPISKLFADFFSYSLEVMFNYRRRTSEVFNCRTYEIFIIIS